MVAGDSHDDLDARRFRDDRRHGAPPRGARQLSALLPNGRTLWLRVADPLAPVAAVRHVAQLADTIADHGHASTAAHAGAIARLSHTVAADARRHHVDAVMCGHIHQPAVQQIDGVTYYNTGDWVESCSAILEHLDGRLELVKWTGSMEREFAPKGRREQEALEAA